MLNISNDSNHGRCCCILYPILYVYYEKRRRTHTFGWKFYHALCSRISLSYLSLSDFYPSDIYSHGSACGGKRIVRWLKNLRPGAGSSLPVQNSTKFILDALFSTNTHLCCCCDHNIFYVSILFLIAILNVREKSMLWDFFVLGSLCSCKNRIFLEGEELRTQIFLAVTMGISKTIFSLWKSCRQTTGYCF